LQHYGGAELSFAAFVDEKRALSGAEKGKEMGEWYGKRHISAVMEGAWTIPPVPA
jgi:hypothetical protein